MPCSYFRKKSKGISKFPTCSAWNNLYLDRASENFCMGDQYVLCAIYIGKQKEYRKDSSGKIQRAVSL